MDATLIVSVFNTPIGLFETVHNERCIFKSYFTQKPGASSKNSLTERIEDELLSYFSNPHHKFQLTLVAQGSSYQQKVWDGLLKITAGHTLTYGEFAKTIQSAPRAIGQACKRNPIALFIPCHRVVAQNDLGGYMGDPEALTIKSALLTHEKALP